MLSRREALQKLGLATGALSLGSLSGCQKSDQEQSSEPEKSSPSIKKSESKQEPKTNVVTKRLRSLTINNNLKNLSLAARNFSSSHRNQVIPQAICAADGTPLLSGRVMLLPHLDQSALYRNFREDEPWDSKHNLKLLDVKVNALSNYGEEWDGTTTLQMPLGPMTVFGEKWSVNDIPSKRRKVSYDGIAAKDGMAHTFLFVEVDKKHAIPWTKPDDIVIDPKDPADGLADHDGEFQAAFCDGHVALVRRDIPKETLNALFSWNGGEIVKESDY
jgi:prepilin-type processing-associated H-X9-DG protein